MMEMKVAPRRIRWNVNNKPGARTGWRRQRTGSLLDCSDGDASAYPNVRKIPIEFCRSRGEKSRFSHPQVKEGPRHACWLD